MRLPAIDEQRRRMLERAERQNAVTVRSLLAIICYGIAQIDIRSGDITYAMFLRSLVQSSRIPESWPDFRILAPWTHVIVEKLRAMVPHLSDDLFYLRLHYASTMFIDAIHNPGLTHEASPADNGAWAVEVAIDMAVGGLCAPVWDAVATPQFNPVVR
jgi:hypothetical protein